MRNAELPPFPSPRTFTSRFMGSKSESRLFGEVSPPHPLLGRGKAARGALVFQGAFVRSRRFRILRWTPKTCKQPIIHSLSRRTDLLSPRERKEVRGYETLGIPPLSKSPAPLHLGLLRYTRARSRGRRKSKAVSSSAPVTPGFCHRTPKSPAPPYLRLICSLPTFAVGPKGCRR